MYLFINYRCCRGPIMLQSAFLSQRLLLVEHKSISSHVWLEESSYPALQTQSLCTKKGKRLELKKILINIENTDKKQCTLISLIYSILFLLHYDLIWRIGDKGILNYLLLIILSVVTFIKLLWFLTFHELLL